MDDVEGPRPTDDSHAAASIFRREGGGWLLVYAGRSCWVRDASGMRHLAHLLARPGQRIGACLLLRAVRRRWAKRPVGRAHPESVAGATAAMRQARTTVRRSVRAAIERIARHHAPLGAHLATSIRIGTYCAYAPDDPPSAAWRT